MLSQDADFHQGQVWRSASLSDSHKGGDTSKAIQWLLHMGCTGIYRSVGEQSLLLQLGTLSQWHINREIPDVYGNNSKYT